MAQDPDIRRYRDNLRDEVDGAAIYEALASAERDPKLAAIYQRLAQVEQAHAQFWRDHLSRRGVKTGDIRPSVRARSLAWLARRFGPALVLPTLSRSETMGSAGYDLQPEAVTQGMSRDERGHARIIRAAAKRPGGVSGSALAQLEGRHRGGGGNTLRASVLGANDGLVSNLSLVMGVAGAAVEGRTILLTGLAGLVAGACSMAMGEWLSVNSARELAEKQIATEAAELEQAPEEEKEELVLIYQAKGLDEASARALADRLFTNADAALDALVREELGVDPDSLGGSAWAAAGFSFLLFAVGAIFPVAPFLFSGGSTAVVWSLGLSGVALAGVGAATSLFTGRSLTYSAIRQLLIGYAAAAITFGAGKLVGASIG